MMGWFLWGCMPACCFKPATVQASRLPAQGMLFHTHECLAMALGNHQALRYQLRL